MKGLYTIPSGHHFLAQLAKGLAHKASFQEVARMKVFLPTPSALLFFTEHWLCLARGHQLMPFLCPLGQINQALPDFLRLAPHLLSDLPKGLKPFHRHTLLARLVHEKYRLFASHHPQFPPLDLSLILSLTKAFEELLDMADVLEGSLSPIQNLANHDFSAHWEISQSFLAILSDAWPHFLAQENLLDPYALEKASIDRLLASWDESPPSETIVVAGSTGTTPRIRRLMKAVLALPNGLVVLPGFDPDHPSPLPAGHPQHNLAVLLDELDVTPSAVQTWPHHPAQAIQERSAARRHLCRALFAADPALKDKAHGHHPVLAQTPFESKKAYQDLLPLGFPQSQTPLSPSLKAQPPALQEKDTWRSEALKGLSLAEMATPFDEALLIALSLRGFLEKHPAGKAVVITPDTNLLKMVAGHLKRFGLLMPTPGGQPLGQHPLGCFMMSVLDVACHGEDACKLLSLLKHPFSGLLVAGRPLSPVLKSKLLNLLEIKFLRANKPLAMSLPSIMQQLKGMMSSASCPDGPPAQNTPLIFHALLLSLLESLHMLFQPLTTLALGKEKGGAEENLNRQQTHSPATWSKALWQTAEALLGSQGALSSGEKGLQAPCWQTFNQRACDQNTQQTFGEHIEALRETSQPLSRPLTLLEESFHDLTSEAPNNQSCFWPLSLGDFSTLFNTLVLSKTYNLPDKAFSPITLLSNLDARLVGADYVVIAGLNENHWPGIEKENPWLNLKMRQHLGLDDQDKQRALAAHDFVEALCHQRVLLTRSKQSNQGDLAPSPFLLRLKRTVQEKGLSLSAPAIQSLAQTFFHPDRVIKTCPPSPCPPLTKRPRVFSPSSLELLRRNPYGFYARHILRLKPQDPLGGGLSPAFWGNCFHNLFEVYGAQINQHLLDEQTNLKKQPSKLTSFLAQLFNHITHDIFLPLKDAYPLPTAFALEKARRLGPSVAKNFAEQIAQANQQTQQATTPFWLDQEVWGRLVIYMPSETFTLRARADRLDTCQTNSPGGVVTFYHLIDYKTGQPPTDADIRQGFSPQLPLEGLILSQKGFGQTHKDFEKNPQQGAAFLKVGPCRQKAPDPQARPGGFSKREASLGQNPAPKLAWDETSAINLSYWHLAADGLRIRTLKNPHTLIEEAWQELIATLLFFHRAHTPYRALPLPAKAPPYDDYALLSRVQEWRT